MNTKQETKGTNENTIDVDTIESIELENVIGGCAKCGLHNGAVGGNIGGGTAPLATNLQR